MGASRSGSGLRWVTCLTPLGDTLQSCCGAVGIALVAAIAGCADERPPLASSDSHAEQGDNPEGIFDGDSGGGNDAGADTADEAGASGSANQPEGVMGIIANPFGPREPSSELPPGDEQFRWRTCGLGHCGTLDVPLDYDNPAAGSLGLRVFFGAAYLRQARDGVLMFNPGGPGSALVSIADELYTVLASAFPTLDIVLIDNRGVGQSQPIDCAGEASLELDIDLDQGAESFTLDVLKDLQVFWKGFANGCDERLGEGTLTHYHSNNVARDVEQVRQALGADKIHLWSASYGTVQASLYAAMFPEHVGAFVLEAPVHRGELDFIADTMASARAYDRELERLLEWCSDGDRCGLGSELEGGAGAYDALLDELHSGVAIDAEAVDPASLELAMGTWLLLGEWEAAAVALEAASAGDFGPIVEAAQIDVSGSGDDEAAFAFTQANLVVRLLDYGCPEGYSPEQARRLIARLFEEHPRFAFSWFAQLTPCLGWDTQAAAELQSVAALKAPPLLLIASAHDPATPLSGAEALQAEFDNGSALLVYDGEGHGAVGRDDDDITLAFLDFISSGGQLPSAPVPIDRTLPSASGRDALLRSIPYGVRGALPLLPSLGRFVRLSSGASRRAR